MKLAKLILDRVKLMSQTSKNENFSNKCSSLIRQTGYMSATRGSLGIGLEGFPCDSDNSEVMAGFAVPNYVGIRLDGPNMENN